MQSNNDGNGAGNDTGDSATGLPLTEPHRGTMAGKPSGRDLVNITTLQTQWVRSVEHARRVVEYTEADDLSRQLPGIAPHVAYAEDPA